jgi:hypothetical protein
VILQSQAFEGGYETIGTYWSQRDYWFTSKYFLTTF